MTITNWEDMLDDPEPPNEDDPNFKAEVFEGMRALGWTPEDLKDPKDAAEYRAWLKNARP